MEFLSNLSTMQRAAAAAILVLVLVLLVARQRQAKSAPGTASADAKPSKKLTTRAPKAKGRSMRKRTGDPAAEPVAEPKAASGRMVPRLPTAAAMEEGVVAVTTAELDAPAAAEASQPVAAAGAMINEPGWPTPGEVWAAPGAAPVPLEAAEEIWQSPTTGVGDHDDPLAALTEGPSDDTPSWLTDDSDAFDPATGWGDPDESDEPPSTGASAWEQPASEDEQLDWAAGDALDGWATAGDDDHADELSSAEAAWESPEDEMPVWTPPEESPWEAPAIQEEPAPVATAVAEPEGPSSEVWDAPSGIGIDPPGDADEIPAVVWEPVDETEDDTPVVAVVAEPVFEPVAAMEPAQTGPVVVNGAPRILAGAEVVDPVSRWASMVPGGVGEARPQVDPAASWARLRPGQPAVQTNGSAAAPAAQPAPLASPVAVALAPSPSAAPSVTWWDVPSGAESDPHRGRFALGGYALQPGHQVVSGVTFRDRVVPSPSHWVIGPVVGAVAPGTLVLTVDGCLNCRSDDLAVIMDPGFAPTTDGFSLKLTASEQGPFAASGTYVIS